MKKMNVKLLGILGMAAVLPFMAAGCNMGALTAADYEAEDGRYAEKTVEYNSIDFAQKINKFTDELINCGSSDPEVLDEIAARAYSEMKMNEIMGFKIDTENFKKDAALLKSLYNTAVSKKRIDKDMELGFSYKLGDIMDYMFADNGSLYEAGKKSVFTDGIDGMKEYAAEAARNLDNAVYDYVGEDYDEPFPMVVDYVCRNAYAFESQGYSLRESMRKEYASLTANAGFMAVYDYISKGDMDKALSIAKFINAFDAMLEDTKVQDIVRHDDKIICQIPFEQSGETVYYVMDKEVKTIDYVDIIKSYSSQWYSDIKFNNNKNLYKQIYNGHKNGDNSVTVIDYMPKEFYGEIICNWSNGKTLQDIFEEVGFEIPNACEKSEYNCFVYAGDLSFDGYHHKERPTANGSFDSASVTAYPGSVNEAVVNNSLKKQSELLYGGEKMLTYKDVDSKPSIAIQFDCGYTTKDGAMIRFDDSAKCFGKKVTGRHFYYNSIAQVVKNLGDIK